MGLHFDDNERLGPKPKYHLEGISLTLPNLVLKSPRHGLRRNFKLLFTLAAPIQL